MARILGENVTTDQNLFGEGNIIDKAVGIRELSRTFLVVDICKSVGCLISGQGFGVVRP